MVQSDSPARGGSDEPLEPPLDPPLRYYEFAIVEPMWDAQTLMYRVKLPLVESQDYLLYQFHTWPVPFNSSGYSAQLEVEMIMGIDTRSEYIFQPSKCYGQRPQVCRASVRAHRNYLKCESALLDAQSSRDDCVVTIRKEKVVSKLTEISSSEYVLITWGETVHKRCAGTKPVSKYLAAGVYAIILDDSCMYTGKDWVLTPITEMQGRLSILSLRIEIEPIDLVQTVGTNDTVLHLETMTQKELTPVFRRTLKPIKHLDYPELDLNDSVTDTQMALTISLLTILTIIVLILIIIGLRKYGKIQNCNGKDTIPEDVERNQASKCDIEVLTEAFPLTRLVNEKLYPNLDELSAAELHDDGERITTWDDMVVVA